MPYFWYFLLNESRVECIVELFLGFAYDDLVKNVARIMSAESCRT